MATIATHSIQLHTPTDNPALDIQRQSDILKTNVERINNPAVSLSDHRTWKGIILRFQAADSYAYYMITNTTPTASPNSVTDIELSHIKIADGWSIPDPYIRGLTTNDIRTMIAQERALIAMFSNAQKTG